MTLNFIGMVTREGKIIVRAMKEKKVGLFLDDNPLIAYGFNLGRCSSQKEANTKMANKLSERLYPLFKKMNNGIK